MKILALDQSTTRAGWALINQGDVELSGFFSSRGGEPVAMFRYQVKQLILDMEPNALVWERPAIFRSQRANLSAARLDQVMRDLGAEHGLPVRTVGASTWRSQVLGKGAGKLKSEEAKNRALFYCHMIGFQVRDHNQAEAICIGLWGWGELRHTEVA